MPTDADLLERVRSGDTAAIDALLARAQGVARRYSLAVCGRAPDSEDAMQEALLQTFRHARSIREPKAFRAWLYRVVKHACLIGRRRVQRERLSSSGDDAPDYPDTAPPVDETIVARETRATIQRGLAGLSPAYREAIFLRDLEGLSTKEVARVLGITEANVKVRLHRAHVQLRKRLSRPE